jgi:exosortase
MTTTVEAPPVEKTAYSKLAFFAVLVVLCYAPVIYSLAGDWMKDEDMGHGFFVPVVAAYLVWQQKDELMAIPSRPNWLGLPILLLGASQLIVATLGVEHFLARTALIITITGAVLFLKGVPMLKKVAFPLFLLCFMVPIPSVIFNSITFPLQILASQLADLALSILGVPVLRGGNVLELPSGKLSVVEACSGIRSLLSLTFLSLVYGRFFEKRGWMRVVLFLATVPIAIAANGGRVTLTGILSQIKPELAEGFFHESTGWVIFMLALGMLLAFHQVLTRVMNFTQKRAAQ